MKVGDSKVEQEKFDGDGEERSGSRTSMSNNTSSGLADHHLGHLREILNAGNIVVP